MKRALLMTIGLISAAGLASCCSDSDKKSLNEMVERAIDRNFKACESISDPPTHATCITNAQNQQTALVTAYAAYLTACATGDTELIKDALKHLKDLLKSTSKAILGAAGAIVNSEMVLGKEEGVCFSILLSSDGSTKPQDFVVVNGVKYLPEAAGSAALATTGGSGSLTIATVAGDATANSSTIYQVTPGSTICFNASGMSMAGVVSGSISLASVGDNSVSSFLPTDASLTIEIAGSSYLLSLDKTCKYNSMMVGVDGQGTLSFRVNFAAAAGGTLPARLPDGAWMVMPVQRNTTGTQLRADTGDTALGGWQVFPTLPNPIADFDRNAVANQADVDAFLAAWSAGIPSADVNHDGVVNFADYDLFIQRWDYWSQP